jgi:hypothetical protein
MEGMSDQHVRELNLRRLRAGELKESEAQPMQAHLAECARCRTQYKELEHEQHQFEQQISFDRFAAGVERALRTAQAPRPKRWLVPAIGMAAAVMVGIVLAPSLKRGSVDSGTRLKGGPDVVLRVGGPGSGAQRTVSMRAPEALSPGERVRIGYQPGTHQFLIAVSIDEAGLVTPLYPESGSSIPVSEGEETHYLPESLEFTGRGGERVIVILGDRPLQVSQVERAAQEAYQAAGGDLRQLGKLKVGGEQFQWLLLKP